MSKIIYKDRGSDTLKTEKVYGKIFLEFLYGKSIISKVLFSLVLPLIANIPFFSKIYGKKQKSPKSRKKIIPFIRSFNVDPSEFADPVESFKSFNDFFIRKLIPQARPISHEANVAIIPADGRYLVYPNIHEAEGFYVKGKKFNLFQLLQDKNLFEQYKNGSMVIGRLCPTDYHRFHFPCDCFPQQSKEIKGPLFSVNPIALRRYINIINENKRVYTQIETQQFSDILYIEVGATFVGSIKQTYSPRSSQLKGDEKGYFEFGGSCIILLFLPNTITFSEDLIKNSAEYIETKANFGTDLGRSK